MGVLFFFFFLFCIDCLQPRWAPMTYSTNPYWFSDIFILWKLSNSVLLSWRMTLGWNGWWISYFKLSTIKIECKYTYIVRINKVIFYSFILTLSLYILSLIPIIDLCTSIRKLNEWGFKKGNCYFILPPMKYVTIIRKRYFWSRRIATFLSIFESLSPLFDC